MSRVLLVTPAFHGYGHAIAHALDRRGHDTKVHAYDAHVGWRSKVRHQLSTRLPAALGLDRTAAESTRTTADTIDVLTAHRPDVVVVVSAKSSASKLTKEQVADIFLGRSTSMVPLDQAAGSPVRDEFYTKVAGQSAAQVKTVWAKLSFSGKGTPPKALGSDDEVKAQLAANPNAIAYMDKSKVDASVKTVLEP